MARPTTKPVVIFGAGTLAQVVATYLGRQAIAFTVDKAYMKGGMKALPTVPFETIHKEYPPHQVDILVAVTQQNRHRFLMRDKYEQIRQKGYGLATFISGDAIVPDSVEIKGSVLVCPAAIVEAYSCLHRGIIVRTGAYIGHHVTVGPFSYIAPRASIAGHTKIGQNVFIGNNATIRDRVTIGDNSVIGCGVVVLSDVAPNTIIRAPSGFQLHGASAKRIDI